MIKSIISAVQLIPAIIMGRIVVAYIHTKARKIVLPMAIFRKARKCLLGIFGAEYKNVIIADKQSQNQCVYRAIKKKTDPATPIIKRMI